MAVDNTWIRSHVIAVGTAPELVAKASAGRRALNIVNSGGQTVHLHTDESVSSSVGITLQADGSVSFTEIEDFAQVRFSWYCLSDAAGGQVTVYEAVERTKAEGGAQ